MAPSDYRMVASDRWQDKRGVCDQPVTPASMRPVLPFGSTAPKQRRSMLAVRRTCLLERRARVAIRLGHSGGGARLAARRL